MAKVHTPTAHAPLQAEPRTERGSRRAQTLRAAGRLPGVLYGMGKETLAISVEATPTVALIHSGSHTAQLSLGGVTETVLVKAVQYDYLDKTMEHVDFLRVDPTQRVEVTVSLEFRGTPKGAKEGGILETILSEIEIETLALEIPDVIRVNVEELALHDAIHAKDVKLPAGATLITDEDQVVCAVRTVKEEEEVVEAGPAEPEVIGRKKEDEEGTEGAAPAKGGAAGKGGAAPAKGAPAPAKGAPAPAKGAPAGKPAPKK